MSLIIGATIGGLCHPVEKCLSFVRFSQRPDAVTLTAITANLDIPGGNLFPMFKDIRGRGDREYTRKHLITEERSARILGSAEVPQQVHKKFLKY
jgi:hypothetical protein